MAGLFLVQTQDSAFAETALAEARTQFGGHGFTGCTEHELPGWRLLHAPYIIGGPETLLAEGDDLAAVAGTLICDGKMGREALRALLAMADLPKPDWSRLGGHFVALVRRAGRMLRRRAGGKGDCRQQDGDDADTNCLHRRFPPQTRFSGPQACRLHCR